MERVLFVVTPHGCLVIEAIQTLLAVLDRTKGFHGDLLKVRRGVHRSPSVSVRHIDATLALPLPN